MEEKAGWRKALATSVTVARYLLLFLLPGVVALFAGFAGMNSGTTRMNLIYAAAVSAILLAGINILKDIQARKAGRSAIELASSLHESTQPLLTLLARVTEAKNIEDRRAAVLALMTKVVGIARVQCGVSVDKRCKRRAVYYHFLDRSTLKYQYSEGRDDPKPRKDFIARGGKSKDDDNSRKVIELARGGDSVLIKDVDKAPPAYYSDYEGRPYRTFLMVPVRTEQRSFGFLSVDTDKPNTITKTDAEYAIVLAQILASGFAQLDGDYPQISQSHATPNQRPGPKSPAKGAP